MKVANFTVSNNESLDVIKPQISSSHRTLFAMKQKSKRRSCSDISLGSCTLETKTRTTKTSGSSSVNSQTFNLSGGKSNDEIRCQFLRKLGIHQPSNHVKPHISEPIKTQESILQELSRTSLLKDAPTFSIPLKYKEYPREENYTRATSIHYAYHASSSINRNRTTRKNKGHRSLLHNPFKKNQVDKQQEEKDNKRKIGFSSEVSVLTIPKHEAYSDRIKTRLWSNRHEIQNNAQRNYIEFAAEGWDWRSVTEENNMFYCTASGELIHPVHCRRIYQNWQIHQQRQLELQNQHHLLQQQRLHQYHLQQQHLHNHHMGTSSRYC